MKTETIMTKPTKTTPETAPKKFDKTNTCQVSIIKSKKNGKEYPLFTANIKGYEVAGVLFKRDGLLKGDLRAKKESEKPDATVAIRKNVAKSLSAPVYVGTITGKNSFEVALWERFGKSEKGTYHFWSGNVKTEEEASASRNSGTNFDDDDSDFLLDFNEAKKLREDNSQSAPNETPDDLPF